MEEKHILEKLVEVSPGMEIWWDSSPLIFNSWCEKMLNKANPNDAEIMIKQFPRMCNLGDPTSQLFQGVTTNPPLSLKAIRADEESWTEVVDDLIRNNPGIDKESLFWLMYKEVVKRGSDMYISLFEQSGYKKGYLSAQVDPRNLFDKEKMIQQAEELAALNPNIMIKIPGSKEGYDVIKILTSRGISTNNTLTLILSQLVDCAKSVKEGLKIAQKNNVDLSKWRSVITYMAARYGDLGGLMEFGKEKGIELSEADVRLAELAIFKKAYKFIKDNDYPSKMLICSLRIGPTINDSVKLWHLEEIAGADIVVTCPPGFIEQLYEFSEPAKLVFKKGRILENIPKDVMDKLMRIPYFEMAYSKDGYSKDEYKSHPALTRTAEQFSKATTEMVEFAGKCLENSYITS